jgi:hypothetical protein
MSCVVLECQRAGHLFTDRVPDYDAATATVAWERSLGFLAVR